MNNAMLDAIARSVRLLKCGYTFSEAIDTARMEYRLDEFENEDLERHVFRQYARVLAQMETES